MYTEKVMDHFTNPRNVGEIENASGVGTVGNAKCGDIMKELFLYFKKNKALTFTTVILFLTLFIQTGYVSKLKTALIDTRNARYVFANNFTASASVKPM